MTNFEHLCSNKNALVELLDNEGPFWQRVGEWYCKNSCPRSIDGECKCEECVDTHTTPELINMWLDSEVCELPDV